WHRAASNLNAKCKERSFHVHSTRAAPRLRLRGSDRALLVWITQIWPNLGMTWVDWNATEHILGFQPALRR
ncbi:MAG TPA: hypothetical protein VK208_05880, partial [Pyrinomonadaceae bacterium]|nr:hypothetical protein [Pyrinomonadaceae bacterium]